MFKNKKPTLTTIYYSTVSSKQPQLKETQRGNEKVKL